MIDQATVTKIMRDAAEGSRVAELALAEMQGHDPRLVFGDTNDPNHVHPNVIAFAAHVKRAALLSAPKP